MPAEAALHDDSGKLSVKRPAERRVLVKTLEHFESTGNLRDIVILLVRERAKIVVPGIARPRLLQF